MTIREKNRPNPTGRIHGWKSVLNTLTVHYGERLTNPANQADRPDRSMTTITAQPTKKLTDPHLGRN